MLINSSHKQAGTLVKERQHTIDLAKVKTNIIGATWLIGKSGACYAADPGLKQPRKPIEQLNKCCGF